MAAARWFQVGGLRLAVQAEQAELALTFPSDMELFACAPGPADLTIDLRTGDPSAGRDARLVFDSGALWQLFDDGPDHLFRFTSQALGPGPYRSARMPPDASHADVVLDAEVLKRHAFYPMEYPLDELLFITCLGLRGGIEMHACGVIDEAGQGHLFVGQSGAGKTTTAHLWRSRPGVSVLSDDRIVLRVHDGMVWMYGTPWHGDAALAAAARAPVRTIHLLCKGPENRWVPVTGAMAAARLLACSFAPVWHRPGLDAAVALAAEIALRVKVGELWFVPDARAVDFVLAGASSQ